MKHTTCLTFGVISLLLFACGSDKTAPPKVGGGTSTGGGTGSQNTPPQLYKIGNKIVQVNSKLVIQPKANDTNGDKLNFSLYGDKPKGHVWNSDIPRFEWTPPVAGTVVSLTFFVSDGKASDSESIEVKVVTEAQNHPPAFQKVGDQAIEAGSYYVLTLQASDPNGDLLIYGHEGTLPEGAVLNNNVFEWTPELSQVGTQASVTFTATDGQTTKSLEVQFYVVAPGQNKPPIFVDVGPQIAEVGLSYALSVNVVDPDGDNISVAYDGTPPANGQFDTASRQFNWIPDNSQAGKVFTLTFVAKDAKYTTYWETDVTVKALNTQGQCTNDVFEANNSPSLATPITTGTYSGLSICDTELSPVDSDWFVIPMTIGQTLSVKLSFTHAWGDLDVRVYGPNEVTGAPIAIADSADDNEVLAYAIPKEGKYYVQVLGVSAANFANTYDMEISTSGVGCEDDSYEPNDDIKNAQLIESPSYLKNAKFCPGDPDVFKLPIKCGQNVNAAITFNGLSGDLNLHMYRENDTTKPVASSNSTTGTETVAYEAAPYDENIYVEVTANPVESTINTYDLSVQASGVATCNDDSLEPNDDLNKATFMAPPSSTKSGLSMCCSQDWFYVPLTTTDVLTAVVEVAGNAPVQVQIREPGGKQVLANGVKSSGLVTATLEKVLTIGNHYVVVEGPPGKTYSLTTQVKSSAGCSTSKGCKEGNICVKGSGECIDDACLNKSDCPVSQEMPCIDLHCLDACTYDADCRLTYACKGFDKGRYCGVTGSKKTGDPCSTHEQCSGQSSCHFQNKNGYCSNVGCKSNADCANNANCVKHTNYWMCAKTCSTNGDCRKDDGFTCQPKTLPNGIPSQTCLPPV